jgi:DNA-binding NarL/FixJ family response regulator
VAEAATGRELVRQTKVHRPDVVVLAYGMRELNGTQATRQILKVLPNTRMLMVTAHDEPEVIEDSVAAGIAGYILKSDTEQELVSAVKALANRRTHFTSIAREIVLRQTARKRSGQELTPRETEIVQFLAEGESNKQIAGLLAISQRTVENHRAKIMDKLGLASFSELVRYAIRHKIIEP